MLYDLIIIGSGPAGCSASIYASRYKLTNLILGKTSGGTISYAHKVDNYPGLSGLSGITLMEKMEAQVKSLGGNIIYDPVMSLTENAGTFTAATEAKKEYQARAVIVATGTERRRLNVPGEKELVGKGVSYCVTCDAPFYKDKIVALIGGSDAACSGAVHLSEYAKKIYLIYRKSELRAEPFWVNHWKELVKAGKGEFIGETNIVAINKKAEGQEFVGSVKLDKPYKSTDVLAVDGVFIEIGGIPGTDLVKTLGVALDESGHVKVSEGMETNISGLFCAGDMVNKSKVLKQVVTAAAFGAIAATSAYKYLKSQTKPKV